MSDRRILMYGAPPVPRPRRVGDESQRGFPLPPYIPTPPGEDPQRATPPPPPPAADIGVDIGELLSRDPIRLSTLRQELRAAEESIKATISAEHAETRAAITRLTSVLTVLTTTLTLVLVEAATERKTVKKQAMKKPAKRRAKTK